MHHFRQLFTIISLFNQYLRVLSAYVDSIPLIFPLPLYPTNRTAILISGQLRSGNISFMSGKISEQRNAHYFGSDDPPTPIRTTLEWLIAPLAMHGGVDVFIFIPADKNSTYNKSWNGDPLTYEPYPGDPTACELYSHSRIFQAHTGNRVFCLIEFEKELTDKFIEKFQFWNSYFFHQSNAKEMLLQQEYGKYRANFAAKEYELLTGIKYKYKIRLRPDLAMCSPLPPIQTFTFRDPKSTECPNIVYYPNAAIFYISGEDSFNIGLAEDVDKVMDRYIDLITLPYISSNYGRSWSWSSESNLLQVLKVRYHICLSSHNSIWMAKMRRFDYSKTALITKPAKVRYEWMEMPPANDTHINSLIT